MNTKTAFTIFIIAAMTFALIPMMSVKAADAQVKVAPLISNAIVGQEYTVYVKVTNVVDLYAWEFQLNYDPSELDLTYNAIVAAGLNTPTQTFNSLVDEISGHLWWAVSTTYPTTSGISYTEQAIFEMHFKPLATGVFSLTLSGTILSDSSANAITHTTVNGQISVGTLDLTVTGIEIRNMYGNETWTHSIYAGDTYAGGSTFYYSVIVTIQNTGSLSAANFKVKLEVFYVAALESSGEITVASLAGSTTKEVNFTNVFSPVHTGDAGVYSLKATVDSGNTITEDSELNNDLTKNNFMVTIMGDINGDKKVNILDGVKLSLTWSGTPGSTQWKVETDLNHDNVIDILDGSRISLYWGQYW